MKDQQHLSVVLLVHLQKSLLPDLVKPEGIFAVDYTPAAV